MTYIGIVFVFFTVILVLALVKDQATYRIRMSWIEEIQARKDWYELSKVFDKISHDKVLKDMSLWSKIPFEKYAKSKGLL